MGKELVTCTIDGIEIFSEKGTSILEASKSIGKEIPVLCYHPELSVMGSCRMCVVEIEGEPLLYPSCSTPITNGMKIKTKSDRIQNARRLILEMLLSQHHGDCLTCDASGDCLLEKHSYDYGATGDLFEKTKFDENIHGTEDSNPFILLDRGKCILCGRCVRACDEWNHRNAISFVNKGNKLTIGNLYNKGLEANNECIFCGNCITVCPVGALTEKDAVRKGRFPEIEKIKTICPYCGVGCGLVVHKKGNDIIRVRGDVDSSVSHGRLCIKGKFGLEFVNSNERLRKPLIRNKDGDFEEVSYIDALIYIKDKIDEVKKNNGTFAGLASAKCTNEDNFVFQKFMRTVLETDNIDHCARICHSPSVSGLSMTLGSGAMTNPISDIDEIDCFLIIGSNMTHTHPVISWKIINRIKKGAILILVDPRKTELTKYATIHIQLNPGSDIALLNAMMKIIIDERLIDNEFITKRCEGYDELKNQLENISIDSLVTKTGIDEATIRLAARLYAISGASSIFYAMGITQHTFGTNNVISLANLALITGKVGNGPMGINPLRGQNNVQGASDMGALPGMLPGYKSIEDEESNKLFSDKWNHSIPKKRGKTLIEIMDMGKNKELDFLYIMGENPFISEPDSNSVEKSLQNVGFLVVQDIFLTETAEYADVVLPAASFAEKNGTFTNTERRIQRINKIIDPPGEAAADWKILNDLAELLNFNWNYGSWLDIFIEMKGIVDIYSHINPTFINKKEYFWPADDNKKSLQRLHSNSFVNVKAKIKYVEATTGYEISEDYPFLLITGRFYEHFHTLTMTGKVNGINKLKPFSVAYINPRDALKFKLQNNQWIKVTSKIGNIKIRVLISTEVRNGQIFVPFHYKDAMVNKLTSKDKLDPISKMAALKVVPVNIEVM